MSDVPPEAASASESAFEQAKKYGEDLAKLYAIEKAKRATLQLSNQKLQAIFSATPEGLAVLDRQLTIEEANPAFWALIEQDGPQQGVSLATILPYPALLDPLSIIPGPGQGVNKIELDISLSETVRRSLLFTAAPLFAGQKRGWVLVVHDQSERKRLESLKSEFINIAAHELRTPLAAILGFAQVLKDTMDQPEDELTGHLIDTILDSSNRLKGIVDELVEFADIGYHHERPESAVTFNLIAVVKESIDAIGHAARERELTVKTAFEQLQMEVTGDRNIIKESLQHLLENAVFFNKPRGQITVRLSYHDNLALIDIEDTGIGIPQTEIDRIFDKFYQVEEHLTRSVGGLGLGLAIAQRGIQLHGGVITVRSKLNQGSCFTVALPKTPPRPPSHAHNDSLKGDYRQTIAYGKDLAKAIASERAIAARLKKLEESRRQLVAALEQNLSRAEIEKIARRMAPED
ncbi:MAG: sensor histidine kinase [Anaerolineae bacterium]